MKRNCQPVTLSFFNSKTALWSVSYMAKVPAMECLQQRTYSDFKTWTEEEFMGMS